MRCFLLIVALALVFVAGRPAVAQDGPSQEGPSEDDAPEYVTNPVVPRVADPWVMRHADGTYYMTGSVPAYDRIEIRRAETLQGLAFAEPVTVWRKHESGPMSQHIWAPELHYVDGTWVVHFAASRADSIWNIRMYAISTDAENPLEGEWTERGQVTTGWESFSLDATIFEHRGTRYLIWAQHDPEIGGNTNLYIAKMDSPWSITGEQVMITTPEYDWETQGFRVNEGAAVLKRNGRIFVTYSASATDRNYAMGLLTAQEDADLLDPASWTKSAVPVFQSSPENGVYGPGHNSFTVSADGTTDVLVYHARPYPETAGDPLYDPNRQARMQAVRWAADGTPVFGKPVPVGPYYFTEAPPDEGEQP